MPDYIYFIDIIWQTSHPKRNVFHNMPERETKAMQAKQKANAGSERLVGPYIKNISNDTHSRLDKFNISVSFYLVFVGR